MTNDKLIYEYVLTKMEIANDYTRRSKKGKMAKVEKLGKELVKRELLTQEQADELLHY